MGSAVPTTLHSVVGVRPPADPTKGYFLLQGHMDGFYEAAVDNGTGAAAVLAAAQDLAAEGRDRGLIVALYDGEEWGLLGSKAVAADLQSADGLRVGPCTPDLHMSDIVAVVNLDAPSAVASDGDGLVEQQIGIDVPLFSWRAMVFSEEPTLPGVFVGTMAASGVLGAPISVEAANPVNGGVSRTDGKWFHEAGLAVVWPVAGYPEYHTSADTLTAVDPVDLANVATGTAALIRTADAVPVQRHAALGAPGSAGETVDATACAASNPVVDELPAPALVVLGCALCGVALHALRRRSVARPTIG
jgi:Zn-dependent M28 family amino/carboxypeptidase